MICEAHHEVLPHWLRAAEDGRLPTSGVTVVHFDAHPDLAVPELALPAEPPPWRRAAERVDIATFQLAAVWWGLVDHVVWVRPSWARQLPDGRRRLHVGRGSDGRLRVDDPADYWLLEGSFVPNAELGAPVALTLDVVSLDTASGGALALDGPVIFDVDLDGFATRNPGADHLRSLGASDADLAVMRRGFDPTRLRLPQEPLARADAIGELGEAARRAAGGSTGDAVRGGLALLWRGVSPGALLRLHRIGRAADDSAALLDAGFDLVGLPEHREAPPDEVRATADALAALLGEGGVDPVLVTVARSVDDGYTPAGRWPAIEWALLRALADRLPQTRVLLDARLRPAPRPAPPSAAP